MKVRICSLSKNEDFKSILNGKKISNNYSTIFFKKLNHLNSKQLNISFIAKKRLGNAVIRNKIKRRLKNIMRDLIKNVKVFDVYEGENIPKDKKSIALNVSVQSSEKTLNEKDLEKINNLIISTVESKSGAKIRS